MSTILCLDPGTAHTGIAISHEGILSIPLTTIFEKDINRLVGQLTPIIARYGPQTIVIGQPSYGPLAVFAQNLGDHLKHIFSGNIIFFPENMSSISARSVMKAQHKTLAKRRRDEHQTAAAIILQNYLDTI